MRLYLRLQIMWLLLSLIGLDLALAFSYDQQVIIALESSREVKKAAEFLRKKHNTVSSAVIWDGSQFQHIPKSHPLPTTPEEWSRTRIQLVGHGDITSSTTTIAGFTPESLAATLRQLYDGNIGRISIVGCSKPGSTPNGAPEYLDAFMKSLKTSGRTETEVSMRSALVSVDRNGRKLTGELILNNEQEMITRWSNKNPSEKWIGKFKTGENSYTIEQSQVTNTPTGELAFGILPENTVLHISKVPDQGPLETYAMNNEHAFSWVDRIAETTYNGIPRGRAPEVSQRVQFLSGNRNIQFVNVKEIRGLNDLLKELHHYGETGPAQQSEKVYYRFGDWVVAMNTGDFYVNVEGIITDSRMKTNKFHTSWHSLPERYAEMQRGTGGNFIFDVQSWISGEHGSIGLNIENAYNAQCGMAMFLSESIRNFHNHITNMMSIDLNQHGYPINKNEFFKNHPMAHGGTWPNKETGLNLLRSPEYNMNDKVAGIKIRISQVSMTWLNRVHIRDGTLYGSRFTPASGILLTLDQRDVLSPLEDIGNIIPPSRYLRDYDPNEPFLTDIEPELEAINTQVNEFSSTEDISLPLRASMALAQDQAYVSELITTEVKRIEGLPGKEYKVLPNSIMLGQNDDTVQFQVQEKLNPSRKISMTIDKTKLKSKPLIDYLESKYQQLNDPEGVTSKINTGLAIYSVMGGLYGAINAFENDDVTRGTIGLTQSIHGIGELSSINRAVYKAARKYLGRVLSSQMQSISESVSVIAGEEAGKLMGAAGEALSTIGIVGEALEGFPIIGTIFGGYNIYEDFKQHSTLGYIDGALDIAIIGFSFRPDTLPVVVALTIIRMGIGTFYNDISQELKALPPDASVGQRIEATIKGIGNVFQDIYLQLTFSGQIIGAIIKSHGLDQQYNKDRSFLKKLSDYNKYFTIDHDTTDINFARGSESWNGGNITFHLGEAGHSRLALDAVDSKGKMVHDINTTGVKDIIMGIGESHSISFKKQTVKFLWFIPVHSKTLISDILGERQTLHGYYFGNSEDNKFIAVQELPPKDLGYNLHDYHYRLYGRGGDDTFYLGPQHSYVEGNDGSDTYFVNTTSVHTEINNCANDGMTDYLIFNLDCIHLIPSREGQNLRITTLNNTHTVVIYKWFHDDSYQHMIFKTQDGVLFKVSATGTGEVTLIAYALTGTMSTRSLVLDARKPEYSDVMTLIGTPHGNDELYGNDLDNQLNGGGSADTLTGGEGRDTYIINFQEGVDTINNYAIDEETDTLSLAASFESITSSSHPSTNDLYLSDGSRTGAIIKNWFLNPKYKHMILVSQEGIVLNILATKEQLVHLQPIVVDMSSIPVKHQGLFPLYPLCAINDEVIFKGCPFVSTNTSTKCTIPCRSLDLSDDPLLTEVVTVIGSTENDHIVGNHKDNYISGGRGVNVMEGKEGQDVYVVKEGDGNNYIINFARDKSVDTLLIGADFDDIELISNQSSTDLILTVRHSSTFVFMKQWFSGTDYQHMRARSTDGIVFELPTNREFLTKVAKVVDYSQLLPNTNITLTGKWSEVEQVIGSKGNDTIIGNSLSNYMDPRNGSCYLQGNNGSDTYIIHNYGKMNVIDNQAPDNRMDTVVFDVPLFSINTTILGNDIQMTSITGKGCVSVQLKNYISDSRNRHLTVLTEDGYSFVLTPDNNYNPMPIAYNRIQTRTGQHINLTANSSFSEIRSVYGSRNYQNCIIGNEKGNTIVGGSKSDILQGLGGDDVLKGGAGNDTLLGGTGNDILNGGEGNDSLIGGTDDDIISPGHGFNSVYGGNGTDTVIYSGTVSTGEGIHLNLMENLCIHEGLDELHGIENVYGSDYNDVLLGDDADNVLIGRGGNDHLSPGSGYDILRGGNGNDTYDLSNATGTVVIDNSAIDRMQDRLIMNYSTFSNLVFHKRGSDVIVQAVDIQFPVLFDRNKPVVILKELSFDDFTNNNYSDYHITFEYREN